MRIIIDNFILEFDNLSKTRAKILDVTFEQTLFSASDPLPCVCEALIKSAARVEQTFGGITSRLWDDPFEWTLPEELATKAKILEYFVEVDIVTKKGFEAIRTDEDLTRELPAPEEIVTIHYLLLKTLIESARFIERAQLSLVEKKYART